MGSWEVILIINSYSIHSASSFDDLQDQEQNIKKHQHSPMTDDLCNLEGPHQGGPTVTTAPAIECPCPGTCGPCIKGISSWRGFWPLISLMI